ncbi:MAG: HlyD family type I secretion periplasmic adaptor subunit [Magnetococcales bacterium]|nr:HlyD family type I secretion periplasmic adaptor subunit [Magnetococcales bacterium]
MTTSIDYAELIKSVKADKDAIHGKVLLWSIVVFFLVAIVWAALTEVDEVTRGQGKVISAIQLQQVQSLEGGIIQKILVRKGERVKEGQILIVLDRTTSLSGFEQNSQKRLAFMAELSRLNAEIEGKELQFPQDILENAPDLAKTHKRLLEGRKVELSSQIEVLKQQVNQRHQELNEAQSDLHSAENGLKLLQSEIGLVSPLVKRGIQSEVTLIKLHREQSELTGKRNAAVLKIDRLSSAILEAEERQKGVTEQFKSAALNRASQVAAELAELEKALPAYQDKLFRSEIRSPVRGIVNQVLATTIGGVASPGEALVEIVPIDDNLIIEANISPKDIAFLRPDQLVKVKLTAYDFARYGSLDGSLTTIGADSVKDDTGETFYPVQIKVESRLYDSNGKGLDIVPGMVAQIDILTGKRTILSYIIQPVLKMKETAFRER